MTAKQVPATKSTRVTDIQVPGETTASEAGHPGVGQETPQADAGNVSDEAAALRAENDELRAQIAAAGRAPAAGREANGVKNRADYLSMRANQVDPNTLTKSVLTKDGWVVPPAITQPK